MHLRVKPWQAFCAIRQQRKRQQDRQSHRGEAGQFMTARQNGRQRIMPSRYLGGGLVVGRTKRKAYDKLFAPEVRPRVRQFASPPVPGEPRAQQYASDLSIPTTSKCIASAPATRGVVKLNQSSEPKTRPMLIRPRAWLARSPTEGKGPSETSSRTRPPRKAERPASARPSSFSPHLRQHSVRRQQAE